MGGLEIICIGCGVYCERMMKMDEKIEDSLEDGSVKKKKSGKKSGKEPVVVDIQFEEITSLKDEKYPELVKEENGAQTVKISTEGKTMEKEKTLDGKSSVNGKRKMKSPCYRVSECVKQSKKQFKVSPEAMAVALKQAGKSESDFLTLTEAYEIVNKFLKKEVK